MNRRRGASVTLPVCLRVCIGATLVTGCGPPSVTRNGNIDIVNAAQEAASTVALHDDYTPARILPEGMPASVTARYRCTDGTAFVAHFDNRTDIVRLAPQGKRLIWAGQRPASGIWYAGAGGELRGKGRAMMLTLDGAGPVACTADR